MGMYKYLSDFFAAVSKDDELLRLLVYKPKYNGDDPLSPSLPDIVGSPKFNEVINKNILRTPKSTDLPPLSICRICMYLGNNTPSNRQQSDAFFHQDIIFDVFAHIDDFEMIDCRSLQICDRLNKLLHEEHITGLGKVEGYKILPIGNSPNGYIGYRMLFTFGSTK